MNGPKPTRLRRQDFLLEQVECDVGDVRITMYQDRIMHLGAGSNEGINGRQTFQGVTFQLESLVGDLVVHGDEDIKKGLILSHSFGMSVENSFFL